MHLEAFLFTGTLPRGLWGLSNSVLALIQFSPAQIGVI